MTYNNSIYTVTQEHSCPLYDIDDEFQVRDMALTVTSGKPACLKLVSEIILANSEGVEREDDWKLECTGCSGRLQVEGKIDRGIQKQPRQYTTQQMQLLAAVGQQSRKREADIFFALLRKLDVFNSLTTENLRDFATLFTLKSYAAGKIIIQEGDRGTSLYIILSGTVSVVRNLNESLAEMKTGELFGEMSLMSGNKAMATVYSQSEVKLAALSAKNFKYLLGKYPALQIFFYRLLLNRGQTNIKHVSGNISSAMSGEVCEVGLVELLQLLNSGSKSGRINLVFTDGQAVILLNKGQIVNADFGKLKDKEALHALLTRREGTFTYSSGLSEDEEKMAVLGNFMGLLMEGLRCLDEQKSIEELR